MPEIPERDFRIGPPIWWIIHFDKFGNISNIEEHEKEKKISVTKSPDKTWREFLTTRVSNGHSGTAVQKTARAQAFLRRMGILEEERGVRAN